MKNALKIVFIFLVFLLLSGCSLFKTKVDATESGKDVVKLDIQQLPQLDLSKFKEVSWIIKEIEKEQLSCIDLNQFVTLNELLGVLEGRITIQEEIINKYKGYYEKEPTHE